MYSKYVPASLMCLAVLLTCQTLLAASCLVDPDSKNTRIKPDGKMVESLPTSKKFSDCSRLELVSGMIHVLYETPDGLKRQTCKEAGQICPVTTGTWPSWLDSFKPQSRPGGKKMDEEFSRLPGIPHGKVFSGERAATLNLGKAGFTHWNLTLMEAGGKRPLYQKSGSDPVIQVPSNLLRPGGKYILLIDGSNKKYKGGFDILGGTEAEDIAGQIRQASKDTNVTARGRKLDELIILYENNLDYEVELLRDELQL